MAVLEIETNHYYKINFDRCAVRGLKVFVNYSTYQSIEDRDKEKEREEKFATFFQNIREHNQSKYNELIAMIEAQELVPEQIVEDDNGLIDRDNYPALRAKQDKLNKLEHLGIEIGERLFEYTNTERDELIISENTQQELESLGFDLVWITDPIKLNGGGEVYAGDYGGEPITHEFFYNRLKTVMGDTEDC
ncbi:MAG: hypothetical protein ACOX24_00410 [Christensenellales bacterium]|jgi:hypothetical protein